MVRITKKENEIEYISFVDVLNDDEILSFGLILDKFHKNEIDYQELKSLFTTYGIKATLMLKGETEAKDVTTHANPSDVQSIILNGGRLKNVEFYLEHIKAISVLADFGLPEYIEALINGLSIQIEESASCDDEAIKQERVKWINKKQELVDRLVIIYQSSKETIDVRKHQL